MTKFCRLKCSLVGDLFKLKYFFSLKKLPFLANFNNYLLIAVAVKGLLILAILITVFGVKLTPFSTSEYPNPSLQTFFPFTQTVIDKPGLPHSSLNVFMIDLAFSIKIALSFWLKICELSLV